MWGVPGKTMFGEQRLDDLVVFEKPGIKHRMAAGDAIRLATLSEFASGVGARGIKQPIVSGCIGDRRGYQGLPNQARERIDNVRLVHVRLRRDIVRARLRRDIVRARLRRDEASGLKREVSDKD